VGFLLVEMALCPIQDSLQWLGTEQRGGTPATRGWLPPRLPPDSLLLPSPLLELHEASWGFCPMEVKESEI